MMVVEIWVVGSRLTAGNLVTNDGRFWKLV